jgi:hypothetical protein
LHVDQTVIPQKLREMVDMLVDEEAREEGDTPGVCMEYFLKHGLLHYLVNVSEKMDYPQGIRRESIRTIASMVDILDDKFLVQSVVHTPTIKLLKFCVLDERQSELDHEYLVDLMYKICSKIHSVPGLLDIFFHKLTTPQKTTPPSSSGKVDPPPEYEFLLFTYLLRFVHQDDFARTGLLFLIEMATDKLGDFILTSDFATIVAASLDALYSQLPRKLIIKDEHEINSTPASFLLGQDLDARAFPNDEYGIEHSSSKTFKDQLDSFLKLLEFCQDVLLRCPNDAISERLLQCIRMTFLKNVLYPSILECSDVDGSSVAVISYIDLILQTVHQQDLATVILGFLMDRSDEEDEELILAKLTMASPTKSTMHHFKCDTTQFKSAPYVTEVERYTLKDLIFSQLKSSSQPTVIATLKLLKTLIVKHCRFADRLLSTTPDVVETGKEPSTIVSHHMREIEMYFTLITSIDRAHAPDIMSKGYEEYLIDIQNTIERDSCYQDIIQPPITKYQNHQGAQKPSSSKSEKRRSLKYGQRGTEEHQHQPFQSKHSPMLQPRSRQRIQPTDELTQRLLRLLFHFFTQSSELNLALTGVISALAACPYRSLEGWISFCESDRAKPSDSIIDLPISKNATASAATQSNNMVTTTATSTTTTTEETETDDDQSVDFGVERNSIHMTTPTQFKSYPSFYTQFHTLTQQVDYYRSDIDGFDKLLDERWNGLLFGESTPIIASPTAMSTASSSSLRFFDYPPIMKPSTSSSSVSKFLGLTSPSSVRRHSTTTVTTAASRRRIRRGSTSTSIITMPGNNPSRSFSSSTITSITMTSTVDTYASSPPVPSVLSHQQQQVIVPVINPLSPLGMHAKKALLERVTPLFPSNFKIKLDEPILNLDVEDQDVFEVNPKIPLSMVLNNVVILEETIKELVAIMQVRRSLGIDKIRYT